MNRKIIIKNRQGERYEVKGIIEVSANHETYLCVGMDGVSKGRKWILHKMREAGVSQAYDVPKVDKSEIKNE